MPFLTDESEDRDLQLTALAILHEVELERQYEAQWLCLLAHGGCTEAEARAAMRADRRAN